MDVESAGASDGALGSLQVLLEEGDRALPGVVGGGGAVVGAGGVGEGVAGAVVDVDLDALAELLQGGFHLVHGGRRDALVVGAVEAEQGGGQALEAGGGRSTSGR